MSRHLVQLGNVCFEYSEDTGTPVSPLLSRNDFERWYRDMYGWVDPADVGRLDDTGTSERYERAGSTLVGNRMGPDGATLNPDELTAWAEANDPLQWGWMADRWSEEAHGPYPNRAAAVDAAADNPDPVIGIVEWPYAPDFADEITNVEWAIDAMTEAAFDDGAVSDDEPWTVDNPEAASEELTRLLRNWAVKYVRPTAWILKPEELDQ